MPEIINYTITQTRRVDVSANTSLDAIQIAKIAFEHGQNSDNGVIGTHAPIGIYGNTTSRIQETTLEVKRHG